MNPQLVCRVDYAEITDELRLRAPSYQRLVPDADPARCLLSEAGYR